MDGVNTWAGEGDGSTGVVLVKLESGKYESGGVVVDIFVLAAVANSNVLLKYPITVQTTITMMARTIAMFFCCIE